MDTKSSGYRDFMWAVNLHRIGFEIVGLWPKPNICILRKIYVVQVWGDMILVINNLETTLPQIILSVKYSVMCWKRTVLLSIINMMAADWIAFKLDDERNVMIKRAQIARFTMMIGYIFAIEGFLSTVTLPYFGIQIMFKNFSNQSKSLPLETFYFYDTDKSPQFELTFFVQVVTIFLASIFYMCVDIFLVLIILHICGQLENFRYRLINLISCKDFNKILNNIVTTHLRLIRFANHIENTYSLMMLSLIFYFCIVFCLSGFLFTIILTDGKIDKTIIAQGFCSIFILLISLTNTFLYCEAGELVMEQCNAVYRAICDLEWYKLESRKARSLILLLMRAKYPFRITAGKILPLTMVTFCSILKSSTGYISFLLTKHG